MSTENIYTDAMMTELTALSPVNNDKALAFADKYGISVRSVRAKAVRTEGIEYEAKPRTRKDGSKVELKREIVEDIAKALNKDIDIVETLENANRDVLVMVRDALTA